MKICVVGSINIDLTVTAKRFPKVGETMFGDSFASYFGGKGANQAVAARRLGAEVSMIGKIGKDANGQSALENFRREKIDVSNIRECDAPTGVALITVADKDNEIIVVKGANDDWSKQDVLEARKTLLEADLVMMQLEIPLEINREVLRFCKVNNIPTILNPAPYQKLDEEIIDLATYITPNETEAKDMFHASDLSFLAKYPNKIIMTAGQNGVYYHDGICEVHVPAFTCEVVDTTGAGDTFNGALAVALCEKMEMDEALVFAQKASALAIGKMGAQTAMPTRKEMDEYTVF